MSRAEKPVYHLSISYPTIKRFSSLTGIEAVKNSRYNLITNSPKKTEKRLDKLFRVKFSGFVPLVLLELIRRNLGHINNTSHCFWHFVT